MEFEKCREILLSEYEAVAKAAELQKLAEKAVVGRDWADFEARMTALNSCSIELAGMEREREALFGGCSPDSLNSGSPDQGPAYQKAHLAVELAGGDKGRFYTLCMQFTAGQRSELGNIYRSLKFEALKLRLANESLLKYLNEIRITMADIFEMAFPDRGGKIYTRHGRPVSRDMRSMVLNQSM